MHVASILNDKGRAVETVRSDATVMEVIRKLAAKRIGAVVVLSPEGSLAGIFSERDVIRALGTEGTEALSRPVSDVMTRDVITCQEPDTIDMLMGLMTNRRIRHLPVVENGELAGIVSIGDVVKHHVAEVEMEASAMRDYITTS